MSFFPIFFFVIMIDDDGRQQWQEDQDAAQAEDHHPFVQANREHVSIINIFPYPWKSYLNGDRIRPNLMVT
jgi:hypothetical protein